MDKDSGILYQINDRDEIVYVNDAWDDFARANGAAEMSSQNIIGKSLWSFIADAATVQLYREIVKRVRAGKIIDFQFRCDAPEICRFLKMIIMPAEANGVIFETQNLREWKRQFQPLLQTDIRRTEKMLRICGWCKKIDIGEDFWEETEKAVMTLGLFEESNHLPKLTHGICGDCYQSVSKNLQKV